MLDVDAIQIGFGAIKANKLRSAMTILGVIAGVASVITIIALIQAMMNNIEKTLQALGPKSFIVTKMGIITSRDDYLDALKRKDLTLKDMIAVKKGCPDCEEVGARAYRFGTVKRKGNSLRNVPIAGATANFINILDVEIEEGRFFTETEYTHRRNVVFVGPTIKEELFSGDDPIGKMIKVSGRKFKVIGLAKKRGSTMGNNQDNFILMPLTAQFKLFGHSMKNLDLIIKSATLEDVQNTQDEVRAILRARRGVAYYDDDDFSILTAENILAFVESITLMMRMIIIGIASIAMVVGGIVIMNVMMVAVSERTREIGIRKSIGARRRNIISQFMYETLLLTLTGGVIGTTIGISAAIILGNMMSIDVSVTFIAVFLGLSISTLVGTFFGIYPAMKAARLDPIDALRYE